MPLAIAFADRGLSTVSYDINSAAVAIVNGGHMPFDEPEADRVL